MRSNGDDNRNALSSYCKPLKTHKTAMGGYCKKLAWTWVRRRIRLAPAPLPRHAGEASGLPFSTTKVAAMTVLAGPFVPLSGTPVGT